jgi:hypothetical protein
VVDKGSGAEGGADGASGGGAPGGDADGSMTLDRIFGGRGGGWGVVGGHGAGAWWG